MPPRLSSFDYRGRYAYFVTCCTEGRRNIITTSERVDCIRSQILRTGAEKEFAVPAGVLMADHLHLLIQGLTDDSDFSRFMTLTRQRSGFAFKQQFGERLWQKGYYDRVLRNAEDATDVIDYIAGNPVAAGLVSTPDEYPYLWRPPG